MPKRFCVTGTCVPEKKIVRNPYVSMSEDEMFQRLEKSRESAKNGNYRSAESVISDMRGKYGL